MKTHYLTWYNLENLFDSSGSDDRPDWLKKRLRQELKGWTKDVVAKKIKQLTEVIRRVNGATGPDILGVCEVENKPVLDQLAQSISAATGRSYETVHKDTGDQRGIDIAFIYDADKYVPGERLFSLEVMKRAATRELVQASFTTDKGAGREFIVIGNHWPARSAGQYESEPYRCMVGETLSYWMTRIQEIKGSDAPVVIMGDFNDEPFSRSLTDYALSVVDKDKVTGGRNPYLYNLMWPLIGQRKASFVFDGKPQMFDQILVTKGIAKSSTPFSVDPMDVRLEIFKELKMVKGKYDTPVRFARPSEGKKYNPEGFSDHLPVSCILKEK